MSIDLCVLRAETILETFSLLNPQYSSHIPMSEALVLAFSLPTESCVTLGKSASWELFALRSLTQFLKTYFSLFMWILGCVLGIFTFMYFYLYVKSVCCSLIVFWPVLWCPWQYLIFKRSNKSDFSLWLCDLCLDEKSFLKSPYFKHFFPVPL